MRLALVLLLAACNFQKGTFGSRNDSSIDGKQIDAPSDAKIDGSISLDAAIDAPLVCVAATCAAAMGTCISGTCVINTNFGNVTCPAGMPCRINCLSGTSCRGTVSCGMATSCTIDCQAGNACMNGSFDCNQSSCTVYCRAGNTCVNENFSCNAACTLECCMSNTCNNYNASGNVTVHDPGTCP